MSETQSTSEVKPAAATGEEKPVVKAEEKPAEIKPVEESADPGELPVWAKKRLEQAKSSAQKEFLSALGVESVDDIKGALGKLAQLEEEKLSDVERTEKRLKELEESAGKAQTLAETVKQYADRELAGLSDEQRAAVAKLAGDDSSKVLSAIEVLAPTWAKAAPAASAAATPPASTSAQNGPPSAGSQSPPDHRAAFQRARQENPFLAADIARGHSRDLLPIS